MPYETAPLVDDDVEHAHWLAGDRFWFIAHDARGDHYRLMDAASGTVAAAFNRIMLAAALGNALGKPVDPAKLAITAIKIVRGHLMLTYGTLDDNVPLESTQIVIEALIKANRPFDMIAIANVRGGCGYATPYITRRRRDYGVRYLVGATPPKHFALKPWPWR